MLCMLWSAAPWVHSRYAPPGVCPRRRSHRSAASRSLAQRQLSHRRLLGTSARLLHVGTRHRTRPGDVAGCGRVAHRGLRWRRRWLGRTWRGRGPGGFGSRSGGRSREGRRGRLSTEVRRRPRWGQRGGQILVLRFRFHRRKHLRRQVGIVMHSWGRLRAVMCRRGAHGEGRCPGGARDAAAFLARRRGACDGCRRRRCAHASGFCVADLRLRSYEGCVRCLLCSGGRRRRGGGGCCGLLRRHLGMHRGQWRPGTGVRMTRLRQHRGSVWRHGSRRRSHCAGTLCGKSLRSQRISSRCCGSYAPVLNGWRWAPRWRRHRSELRIAGRCGHGSRPSLAHRGRLARHSHV